MNMYLNLKRQKKSLLGGGDKKFTIKKLIKSNRKKRNKNII